MTPMKGKATSFDIAYLAGVSQSTVSRALRDSPAVNQETKDKIFAIAKQLNIPISYIGLGEKMEDLRPFDGEDFARALLE